MPRLTATVTRSPWLTKGVFGRRHRLVPSSFLSSSGLSTSTILSRGEIWICGPRDHGTSAPWSGTGELRRALGGRAEARVCPRGVSSPSGPALGGMTGPDSWTLHRCRSGGVSNLAPCSPSSWEAQGIQGPRPPETQPCVRVVLRHMGPEEGRERYRVSVPFGGPGRSRADQPNR